VTCAGAPALAVAAVAAVAAGISGGPAAGHEHALVPPRRPNRTVSSLRGLANTNGLGQATCGATLDTCTTIGSAIKP